jgi:hypothetical protein
MEGIGCPYHSSLGGKRDDEDLSENSEFILL